MTQYIKKSAIVAEIKKIIADETESIKSFEHNKNASEVQRSNARIGVLTYLRSLMDTLEVKEVEEITASDKHIAAVTVKEAIERKIINSPFALKGAYSGKMYFYSWKKSISKMPENIANLKLSMNFDNNYKELDSYNIVPMVRLVESSFSNKPFLEPYVLVWVSDYELAKKGK